MARWKEEMGSWYHHGRRGEQVGEVGEVGEVQYIHMYLHRKNKCGLCQASSSTHSTRYGVHPELFHKST